MGYSIFLDDVLMPVAPSKIQTRITNNNKTINLINEGEVNILKSAGLTEIAFEVMIPQVKYPFAVYRGGFRGADYFLEKFEAFKSSKKPFQFKVSRVSAGGDLLFDTNISVSLEDYAISEDASNGLDLIISIRLKQYVEYGTKTAVVKTNSTKGTQKIVNGGKKRKTNKVTPKTYTVKSGDTLWGICKKELGDGSKYPSIAKLNGIENPSKIKTGAVIKLG